MTWFLNIDTNLIKRVIAWRLLWALMSGINHFFSPPQHSYSMRVLLTCSGDSWGECKETQRRPRTQPSSSRALPSSPRAAPSLPSVSGGSVQGMRSTPDPSLTRIAIEGPHSIFALNFREGNDINVLYGTKPIDFRLAVVREKPLLYRWWIIGPIDFLWRPVLVPWINNPIKFFIFTNWQMVTSFLDLVVSDFTISVLY